MSKLKTPQQKKKASLALDGRNVYGENDKSSRKAIPFRKQLSHQQVRRASKSLAQVNAGTSDDEVVATEARILSQERKAIQGRFRKRPDEPLGRVLASKSTGDRSVLKRRK